MGDSMSSKIKAGTATSGAVIDADTTGILELQSGSTPTTAVTVTTAQNVGMGTDTPTAVTGFSTGRKVLQITPVGGGNTQLRLGATSGTMIDHDDSGNTITTFRNLYGASSASAAMQLQSGFITFGTGTSYTERMRVGSDGNLGIGTTSTSGSKVVISCPDEVGGIDITNGNTNGYYAINIKNPSSNHYAMRFGENGNGVGTILTSASATSYNTFSDYRLKENIAPMTGALTKIAQLKPVTYTWKRDNTDGQGFIAHELQAVVPDCVTGTKDATEMQSYEITPAIPATFDEEGNQLTSAVEAVMGEREVPQYQGIDTSFLVATLTAAIQELNAKVDAQAAEIQALKGTA